MLPLIVQCKMVNDLNQPSLRITGGVDLLDCQEKGILHDVSSVLFGKPMPPSRSPHKGHEELLVKRS